MKLNIQQIQEVERQTGVGPVPEDNAITEQLKGHFGDHTFYLDSNGLHVWEWLEAPDTDGQPVSLFQVAAWADEDKTSLSPHEPEPRNTILNLAPDGMPPAA